jgi:hypothetical protein
VRLRSFAQILLVAALTSGCAAALHSPRISEIRNNPGRWQDRTVSINGTVTSSWGVPLVPFRFYKVDDGTGEVTVLSQNARMPTRGAHVRVKGKVNDVGVLGGQALGLHLREESLYVKRGD